MNLHHPPKQPRLLLVLTEFPPRTGGMQTHAFYLAKHLHERGYPICVVTLQSSKADHNAEARLLDAKLPFKVHRVLSRLGYFHNLVILEELAAEFDPDLVYCSTVYYGALKTKLGVPVVSRSVGNDVMRPWIAYPYSFLSAWVGHPLIEEPLHRFFRQFEYPEFLEVLWHQRRRALMRQSARQLTHVLANSTFTQNLLLETGLKEHAVSTLVGGVDYERFAACEASAQMREMYEIPEDRFVILTVCRMVKKKGVDFLIESMPHLLEAIPNLHLVVVGGGRHYKRLKRQARASSAAQHMTLTGRVPHEDVVPFYAQADAFVLASRVAHDPLTGRKDAETMGRVLCEANAAGVTVLASRSGGIPSVVEDGVNGMLFEPDDADSLRDVLCCVVEDAKLRKELCEQGKEIARDKFDWSVILDAHERCFAHVLAETRL